MKQLLGTIIIVIGLVFLLDNLGIIEHELDSLLTLWPLLIVALGVKISIKGIFSAWVALMKRRIAFGKLIFGLIVIGIGMNFLSRTTGLFEFPMSDLWSWTWPVLIIYIGLKLIIDRDEWSHFSVSGDMFGNKFNHKRDFNEEFMNKSKTMVGDINWGKNPWKVGHKELKVGVSDADIDFTTAILEPGENVFVYKGWVGSVEMLVPRDIPVHVETFVKIGDMTIFDENNAGMSRPVIYTSPNYQDAERKLKIIVMLSVGEVGVYAVD
ncbi:cell wall-active antibiotics response protein LiaF [Natranaerobius thermophilus]|uniref:Membrane protein-like protein n=1 Tax=Natranaerobius thermophilus (strain ATCC BAA-1301 / DSM 18059 / JW/NM-WN-LF) TaxID=457570 RepID=B2A757_NATTJ|nr:cell wall-active antibiotics response protein LiaF [Natranaerobius thermophilus]ACB85648.1 membrane protein-like protein [Natranaerobius thermophilus JW/NM-WN-LF]